MSLTRIKNREPNKHIDLLGKFIKKYSVMNKEQKYICRSCKQLLDIQSYLTNPIVDGGVSGIDLTLTTSKLLTQIKQYAKFNFAIKNMDSLIERISGIVNLNYFIGNDLSQKLRRQDIIKNTIDFINMHNKLLKSEKLNKAKERKKLIKIMVFQMIIQHFLYFHYKMKF